MMARRLLLVAAIGLLLVNPISSLHAAPPDTDWPMWGHDLSNTRYNAAETTITPANVSKLTLRWAFAFPDTGIASSQPTVIGDTVYVGSWAGYVYALDAKTGKQRWSFFTAVTGKTGTVRVGVVVSHGLVLFGDQLGRFFAVYQENGALAWVKDLGGHPLAQITGSPIVYGDRVFVPISSREEDAAGDATYACCTFRGGVVALNIADGSTAWHFYATDEPKATQKSSAGVQNYGPSGVGIWSTPALDPDAGLLYLSTGNSYSAPVSPFSDAMIAVNISDGSVKWARQLTEGDWNNSGCLKGNANCEGSHGPDLDFGSAPTLFTIQTASRSRKVVGAGQKNGVFHVLDAMTGDIVWERAVGQHIFFLWGTAYDGKRLYIGDATYLKDAGLEALDPATGNVLWHTGAMPCVPSQGQSLSDCWSGTMAAAVATPGLIWLGAMDGQMRAFESSTGKILWAYNTSRLVSSVNGVKGNGGSIPPVNATVANGQVYVMSGYNPWSPSILSGNMMFVFGLPTGTVKDF